MSDREIDVTLSYKCRFFSGLHGTTYQKMTDSITTAVRTSGPARSDHISEDCLFQNLCLGNQSKLPLNN
jgi:hypothetical protein